MKKNIIDNVENELIEAIQEGLVETLEQEGIQLEKIPAIKVEVPREKEHGDYATNIAMVMAKHFKRAPRQIADLLKENIESDLIEDISVAGPGFINFDLKDKWLYETIDLIDQLQEDYGKVEFGQQKKVLIEFVSANPTGPLHVGHSRGAVVGDMTANIMEAAGYNVDREYYFNDAGNQIDILAKSTLIRYKQLFDIDVDLPQNAYHGKYLIDIARQLKEKYGEELLAKDEDKQLNICKEFAFESLKTKIEEDLEYFGIKFDNWFYESTLHDGDIEEAINILKEKGYTYEKEGALWLKSTEFSDDKDRVIIKSDGSLTYLAADIAYHLDKIERGYDKLINVWGADHHGYINRVKASIQALGYPKDILEIIIVQLVNLMRDGEKIPMSKRAGEFVTMTDVIDEVGKDAARYFYIMRSSDSHFDFDLELAKEQSSNNPVYYIQYAHARIHSILENAEDIDLENVDYELLDSEEEIDLIKLMARYPEVIKDSAESRQPHILANYAYDLANAFHIFYNKRQVITSDKKLSKARLKLVVSLQRVLKNLFNVLGIEAPDQM
ncbi:MAG TPA: arginine--tRNA ligase [Halanaerobiales bacterium]|nr:arginine--tRNA ligase [Halanaerobiales bacterium]